MVIAILHLVGGGLGLLGSLCGCGGVLMIMGGSLSSMTMPTPPTKPGQPAPASPPAFGDVIKYYENTVPGYKAFTFGSLAFSFLLDVMLLSGGVGLLKMQSWARILSLIYAPISIIVRIFGSIYQIVWVTPATKALYEKNPALAGMSSFVSISSGIGVIFGLLLVLYPIAVLIVMLLPSTAAAFRGETVPSTRERSDLGEEDPDDPWREPPRSDRFTT
jgi:hypothetical protein